MNCKTLKKIKTIRWLISLGKDSKVNEKNRGKSGGMMNNKIDI